MRNVLIIIPSLIGGGAEKVLINLLNELDYSRYKVDLYVGINRGVYFNDIPELVSTKFLFNNKIKEKIARNIYIKLGKDYFIRKSGKKIFGYYDVGISFLDSAYTDFLFLNNARINRKITVIHSSYKSYSINVKARRGKHYQRMKERYENLDTIISVSKEAMNEFKEIFGKYNDMRIIYNPIGVQEILKRSKMNGAPAFETNGIKLISVGRLIPVKGHELLINACKLLKDDGLTFQLLILGTGILRESLSRKIKDYGLTKEVKLFGFVKNPYPIMKESDIFVMSSFSEGLPTALCESMVLKKPVIVTNVTGCREIVDNGRYGKMVEPDAYDLYRAMKKLITDKTVRLKYKRLSTIRSTIFDDEKSIKQYNKILNE